MKLAEAGIIKVKIRVKGAWLLSFKLWLVNMLIKNLKLSIEIDTP